MVNGPVDPRVRPAATAGPVRHGQKARVQTGDGSFQAAFRHKLGDVRLTRHAEERLGRVRPLGESDMARLAGAVDRAAARGARESLVIMDGFALVVNVDKRTVITAVDEDRMGDQVFTNIDSAVIVRDGAGPLGGGPGRGATEAAHERYAAIEREVDTP